MTARARFALVAFASTQAALGLFAAHPAAAGTTFTSSDPAADCRYSSVTAQISATGAITYDVYGDCGGSAIGGKLSYDPGTQRFSEHFFNSVEFEDMGTCPADPWSRGAYCTGQKISAQGNNVAQVQLNPALAPFSLQVASSAQLFQRAYASAARPNPPGAPVNGRVHTTVLWQSIRVRWLAPDESGNRPFVDFNVQARPQGAEGAAWSTVGTVPRGGTNYDVTLRMPALVAGYKGWDVRACSVTALAQTCTSPLASDLSSSVLTRQGQGGVAPLPAANASSQVGTVPAAGFSARAARPGLNPSPVVQAPPGARQWQVLPPSQVLGPSPVPPAPDTTPGHAAPRTSLPPPVAPGAATQRRQLPAPSSVPQPPRTAAPPSALQPT